MKTLTVVVVVILSSLLVFQVLGLSQFTSIPSNGTIIILQSEGVESQMRGVLIGQPELSNSPNWTLIASTCASYGINMVVINVIRNYETAYDSVVVKDGICSPRINFTQCINVFHSYKIKVYALFMTMYKAYNKDGIDRSVWYLNTSSNQITKYYGNGWLDVANPAAQSLLHNLVNELVSNYTIDGIVFDYTRWDDYMPLGNCTDETAITNNYDRLSFVQYTGLSDVVWPQDVIPVANGGTGKYLTQWREWRTELVNDVVKNITQWALAVDPNLEFGATPHAYGKGGLKPAYWRYYQGQDFNYWIKQGYVQWVAPMAYTNITSDFSATVQAIATYATGTVHGLARIALTITTQAWNVQTNRTTADIVNYVNTLLSAGGDGWLIADYNGPGVYDRQAVGIPDIRPYLDALGLPNPPTFTLGNIAMKQLNDTSLQISWTTTKPANSTVEYSSSSFYTWAMAFDTQNDFDYWRITYMNGTLIVDSTPTITHTVTITGLTAPYYVRIMSGDSSGIAAVYMSYMGG